MSELNKIENELFDLVRRYYATKTQLPHKSQNKKIAYTAPILDQDETIEVLQVMLQGWLGMGPKAHQLEQALAAFLNVKEVILTNSGSSANLLALAALKSKKTDFLSDGDEVLTPLVNFPTTVNVIYQNGLVPVFIDVELGNYNINVANIEKMISERTRAIIFPHTLGNVVDIDKILSIAEKHNLYVIEDACDAFGSKYKGKMVGSFGDFGTFSFYAAHQMTMGEGGAVVTNDSNLAAIVRSLRDWGRACVCNPCKMVTQPDYLCPQRIQQHKNSCEQYDKRYTYTELGYNLKPTELQAAIGLAQLRKVNYLNEKRKENFDIYNSFFRKYMDYFFLPKCECDDCDVIWFGYPLTIKDTAPFSRQELVEYLESNNIECRYLFAGNITKQPAYKKRIYRSDSSNASDIIHRNAFFLGTYAGINQEKIRYIMQKIEAFLDVYN